ncbi:hypothetical protein [Geothrix fuzhouensis]|uniref:hypothetical protein n=1 Tax=Geothrix fuzhouensis TaxID=2966451 RepID=UPI002147AD7C|nr:hypothetical protein [Geothrix fuzhouensis]
MPVSSINLQRQVAPACSASLSAWTRRRGPAQPVLTAEFPTDVVCQTLRFHRLPEFSRIEDFEDHLATVLNSGVCVFFEGAEPLLLSGRPLVGSLRGLRIELGPEGRAPSRFHVLGPGVDASFATTDGAFLAGEANRRRIDLIRYWYHNAKPYLLRVWNATHTPVRSAGPIDAA